MRNQHLFRWVFILLFFSAVLPLSSQIPATDHPDSNTPISTVLPSNTPVNAPLQPQVTPSPPVFDPTPEDLGDSMQARQRYQAAIAAYSKDPHPSAAVWNKMGIAYQMMFNLRDATRCYNESLRIYPQNPMVLNNLATVYDTQKKFSAAERLYKKALKADPSSALIQKNLGTNLMMQRKYERGAKAYERAIQLDPEIFRSHANPTINNPTPVRDRGAMNYFLARGCARMGEIACALQYLRSAINEGYTTIKRIFNDADFAGLRNDPGFKQMATDLQQQSSSK